MGSADFAHADFLESLDLTKALINGVTASTPRGVRIPPVVETDCAGLTASLATIGIIDTETAWVIRTTDTMRLIRFYASSALVEEARERDDLRVVSEPKPITFADGDFADPPVPKDH